MPKILVADDEPDLEALIKQRFRRQIREKTLEFIFTENGGQALEKIQEVNDIDIVLSDINMPIIDGLSLLLKLQNVNPIIKTVIVSAYGDMQNIRTAMNRGAYDFLCKPINFEDLEMTIDKTIAHVAQLKSTLQAIKENNILKMYVDENVLNFMNRREYEATIMNNENIEATVMFADIAGFTAITEKESPDVVVKLINKYFDISVKQIIDFGGRIDKFMGDCVMAVFKGEFHLDRAIEASLSIKNHIESIEEKFSENLTYLPKISIGLKSGEMISGNIGSATLRRLDFTVIGDTVNTAQRLQSASKSGQIILAEDDYLKVKESFNCQKVDTITVKNKKNPIVIYEVLS